MTDTALVRRVIDEIWNAGDIDLADELFASTYVNHGGLIPDLVKGPECIKFSVALSTESHHGGQIVFVSIHAPEQAAGGTTRLGAPPALGAALRRGLRRQISRGNGLRKTQRF
jgi:hypothetical protein